MLGVWTSGTGARCLESTDLVPGDRLTSSLVADVALSLMPDTTPPPTTKAGARVTMSVLQ